MHIRRGLPRTAGGENWPMAGTIVGSAQAEATVPGRAEHLHIPSAEPESVTLPDRVPALVSPPAGTSSRGVLQRRGLPRVEGGEPWPPGRAVPVFVRAVPVADPADANSPEAAHPPGSVSIGAAADASMDQAACAEESVADPVEGSGSDVARPSAAPAAAAMLVFLVRWLISFEFMHDFLASYPRAYHLPDWAPVGIPWWLSWAHFFNLFLMALIIRSGLTIRTEKRPAAFWTSKRNRNHKVSLIIWFHEALDLLWSTSGLVFVILLFGTGQWVRIVPTSWEVFPNALSALLQFVSLDWPTENGWVDYDSLQQLAYFTTVFLAAPLAAATGIRMSGVWPKETRRLNKLYPVELARAIHFPVMLYFAAFIIVHTALVLATGALRNLNHMYAGQDAVNLDRVLDPRGVARDPHRRAGRCPAPGYRPNRVAIWQGWPVAVILIRSDSGPRSVRGPLSWRVVRVPESARSSDAFRTDR